jgi:lysophospholipase L1-like esterase
MGNFDESRTTAVLVVIFGIAVTGFCVWLLVVWAPTLTVSPSDRTLGGSVIQSSAPQSAGPSDTATSPGAPPRASMVVLGDTFTTGAATKNPLEGSWPEQTCEAAGCDYDPRFAEAGSGFVSRGVDGTRFGERVDGIIAARPDVVVVAGGAYDKGAPEKLLQRRISDVLDRLKTGLPRSRIVVFSPFWRTTPIPPEIRTMRELLRADAVAESIDFVDVAEIFDAPGNELVTDDGLPTPEGQAKIAATVGQAVADNVLQAEGYPGE